MTINLPVENRSHAIRKVIKIMTLITLLLIMIFLYGTKGNFLIYFIIAFVLCTILSIGYIKKHNIKKLLLNNDTLEIQYNKQIINTLITDIIEINSGLNDYINYRGKLSRMYYLYLKKSYPFGQILYLKFDDYINDKIDPEEILLLKERINLKTTAC